ncbi:hypothetical protein FNF27_01130 [Cafeteria roenbergensis]|uniref:Uncharacterized protein n=1 Tax=Cafeteria roenbergensis TaxID=33653 RepID=A0A5A8EIH4_CAFRO|nr:hypothetical protein FNF27_01130 [Cafeteria roenbergensis]
MIRAHWEWSAFMPADWTPGLLQVEEDWRAPAAVVAQRRPSRAVISSTPAQASFLSLYVHRGAVFAVSENCHQGGFLLETGHRWPSRRGPRGCLASRELAHWYYQPQEFAETEPFFRCGLVRAMPLPMVEDRRTGRLRVVRAGDESWPLWASYGQAGAGAASVLDVWRGRWQVHHLPNKYIVLPQARLLGGFPVTDEHLVAWSSMCV